MPFILRNLQLPLGTDDSCIPSIISSRLGVPEAEILSWELVRKGVDARRKGRIRFVLTIRFSVKNEELLARRHAGDIDLSVMSEEPPRRLIRFSTDRRIVIVGSGPAGLFAALRFIDHGIPVTLLERGKPVVERIRDVQAFWGRGELNPESNVQFGEGGAGTFSDGKLNTRVRDDNIPYVLQRLVDFGAPPEIRYLAKPHIGTDRLRGVVAGIRIFLEQRGCRVLFNARLSDLMVDRDSVCGLIVNDSLEIPCDILLLAPGNSSRDTYRMLEQRSVRMEQKPFAVGLRVEHPQELVNSIQYGRVKHSQLPPADYSLSFNDPATGRSAYSFCMCPGGVVVAGGSETGGVVTNGMSNHLRNSPYANSALVVTVGRNDFPDDSVLAGVRFQQTLERAAYEAGGRGYRAPAQNLLAFMGVRQSGVFRSSYRPGTVEADLALFLPPYVTSTLRDGIVIFDRKMRGFLTAEATLTGVETRTSTPLRIVRGDDCQSVNLNGLYPAGEGAGYAGGIMSAALDGIRVADAIVSRLRTKV